MQALTTSPDHGVTRGH